MSDNLAKLRREIAPWRGLQAAASRLVSMPCAPNLRELSRTLSSADGCSAWRSVETSLDAADTSPASVLWPD
jgi:hypothetical protein